MLLARITAEELSLWIGLGTSALVCLVVFFVMLRYGGLWLQAFMSGTQVSLMNLIGMSFRGISPRKVVRAKIMAVHAGAHVRTRELESAYLAGADLEKVTLAYIEAHKKDQSVTFEQIVGAERAGRLKKLLGL
jgi:uncharacterized protein YqfA (UPF0365 family)